MDYSSIIDMDYIIPIFNSGESDWEYREKNLLKIVEDLPDNIFIHLVIQVNQFNKRKISWTDKILEKREWGLKIHQLYYDGPFNKPWLYNYGVNSSLTGHILLGETDIIPRDGDYFDRLISQVNDCSTWAIAWDRILYLAVNQATVIKDLVPKRGHAEGGIVYFNKAFYYKIGGANEFYRGLGGIDNDLARRAEYLSDYNIFKGTICHLWHPFNNMKKDDWKHSKYRDDNIKIYAGLRKKDGPKKEIERLSKYIDEIGSLKGPLVSRFREYAHIYKEIPTPHRL